MAQSDVVKMGAALAAGAAVTVVVLRLFVPGGPGGGGAEEKEVDITLRLEASTCQVTKQPELHVKPNMKVRFVIRNYCTDGAKTIGLGNFRSNRESTLTGCAAPTEGNARYPFRSDDRTAQVDAGVQTGPRIRPGRGTINLTLRELDQGEEGAEYYYDLCIGNEKADPRLIMER